MALLFMQLKNHIKNNQVKWLRIDYRDVMVYRKP